MVSVYVDGGVIAQPFTPSNTFPQKDLKKLLGYSEAPDG
jgi:hypothetical protein